MKKLMAVIKDTGAQMGRAQLLLVASSLAYTTILSIIPLLAVSFAIFKAFGGMDKLYKTIEPFILENLAEGSSEDVIVMLHKFIDNVHASAIGLSGMVALIFTSMSMLSSVEKAINTVWGQKVKRGFFSRISSYWMFITFGPLALAVAVGAATSSGAGLANWLPGWTGTLLLEAGVFTLVYKFVPSTSVHWPYAGVSGIFTSIMLGFARAGYQLYTSKVVTYSKIYGSVGAVPILLLWIYIVWVVILTGAALTAALQGRLEAARETKLASSSRVD